MILPQLEKNTHLVDVLGMFSLMTISCVFKKSNPFGERLAKIAKEKMLFDGFCDQCAVRRGLADGTFEQCGSGQVKASKRTFS